MRTHTGCHIEVKQNVPPAPLGGTVVVSAAEQATVAAGVLVVTEVCVAVLVANAYTAAGVLVVTQACCTHCHSAPPVCSS